MVHYLWLVFAACFGFAVGFFACALVTSAAEIEDKSDHGMGANNG